MAGLDTRTPTPTGITVQRQSRILQISFDDGSSFQLPFEYLRVYSPSAEVRGHGPGQEVLQVGKRMVDIIAVDPVGNYAIRPRFDDGHDSGLYSWDYLYDLGARRDELWQAYLDKLAAQDASRDAGAAPQSSSGGSCGSSGCGSGGCGSHGH